MKKQTLALLFVSLLWAQSSFAFSLPKLEFKIYPDSPFYFLDKLFDFFEENTTQNKAETALKLAKERIEEYRYLKKYKPALAPEFKENELKEQLKKLDKLLDKLDDENFYKEVQKALRVPDLQTDLQFILEEDFKVLDSALAVDLGKIMSADEILDDYPNDDIYTNSLKDLYEDINNFDMDMNIESSTSVDSLDNLEDELNNILGDGPASDKMQRDANIKNDTKSSNAQNTNGDDINIDELDRELNALLDDLNF